MGDSKVRRLAHDDTCRVCRAQLPVGTRAVWNGAWSTVVCIPCTEAPPAAGAASGRGGRSAREEGRRRRALQAASRPAGRWRTPLLRRIERLLRRAHEARDAASWENGAAGEERVAAILDAMAREQVLAARAYLGRIDLAPGGEDCVRLVIGGRDRTRLTDGVRKQADHVRRALGPAYREVPVRGALCFVGP